MSPPGPSAPQHQRTKGRTLTLHGNDIIADGLEHPFWHDIYHRCMTVRWPVFFALIGLVFLLLNLVFAILYQLEDNAIANQYPAGIWGAFFFSVETLATVGYGDMHPQTLYAHLVATIEIFIGMMGIALITGVMFARFSRPRARVVFSAHPVIRTVDGQQALLLRAANGRLNVIAEASAKLRILRKETSAEGMTLRRVHDLKLVREQTPMFVLSWTLIHFIDADSPLHAMTDQDMERCELKLVLSLEGTDESTSQTLLARKIFDHTSLRWNHGYRDLLHTDAQGRDHVDYSRIDETFDLSTETPTHSARAGPLV